MLLGDPISDRLPWVRRLHDLDEARAVGSQGARHTAMRRAAERLGDGLRAEAPALAVRHLEITDLIYPTRFAFQGALSSAMPFVSMRHRCLLVQVEADDELRTILFNPTDREASKATPYFAKIIDRFGWAEPYIAAPFKTVEESLDELGLTPEDVDVLAFDHFHTQDLRPIVGTRGDGATPPLPARFPNATLLAPRSEWAAWDDLHPLQRPWFVRGGKDVDESRVVLTDGDLHLGPGVALLRTPGHTVGNQTLFVRDEQGVFGTSENGTSADSWSPFESRLPGFRSHVRTFDAEVVLNTNTPELMAEQYTSMVLERSVVDRVADAPAFVRMVPSSEVTPSVLAPGIRPSQVFGPLSSGEVRRPVSRPEEVAQAAE